MGLFDWLGPTSLATRRGGTPAPAAPAIETRAVPLAAPRLFSPGVMFIPTSSSLSVAPLDAERNSAVIACLSVLASSVIEPDLLVYRAGAGAERVVVERSPLGDLLLHPNPSLTLKAMLSYATTCLHVAGNAYWRKIRSGDREAGNVVELWPLAPSRIEPTTDDGDFITTYRYTDGAGRVTTLPAANVVHFRYGLDDGDHRVGWSPLRRLYTEISTDQQATRYADRLLANLAINGLTLSFDKDAPAIGQAMADELKARISAAYGGDNAGSTAVLSPGATLTALGFSPEQMDLKTLHRVPEERISAALGVPAIVAGLGAGLDRSTYSNFKEAREAFTEMKLLPLWASLAATMTRSLVVDFDRSGSVVIDFDLSTVRALSEDQDALSVRLDRLVKAGILTADEARAQLGYGPTPATAVAAGSETRSRPRPIRMPVRETRAAEDLIGAYGDLAERRLPVWERELLAFFRAQQRRVDGRLRGGASTAAGLVPDGEVVLLIEALAPLQLAALDDVSALVTAELGIAFQLDDAATRAYLAQSSEGIVGITETTRAQIRAALAEGQARGEGIPELARRLRQLPSFDRPRAETVARTELGRSQNHAALASYRASGVVVGVRVHDGDHDAACQAMDGRTFALDHAPSPLEHPNCLRAFSPVTETGELQQSA